MDQTLDPAITTRAASGRWRGFEDGARELDDTKLAVSGALPHWLRGGLLLNGPALWQLPGGGLRHWFDGYAMLHRVAFDGRGGASYRSRFVASQAFRDSRAAGRPVSGEFGTPNPAGLLQRLKGSRATDNPAVVMSRHGRRWFAVSETPYLTYFDPQTLATLERLDLHDRLGIELMSAHGFTLDDGSYLNVGVSFGRSCAYRVFRLPAESSEPQLVAEIAAAPPGYLHGFALASGHAIVWECSLRAQVLAMRFGAAAYKDHFRWQPASGAVLHAVPLAGGAVRSWRIPPLMAFHATQAWAEGDDLLVEIAAYADASIFDDLTLERRRAGEPLGSPPMLQRYRLQPGRDVAEPEPLGCSMELQQVHPAAVGHRRARVCFGIGASARGGFGDHVLRLDLDRGTQQRWQRPAAMHLEPLFVPRPSGSADDDGVLLVPTLADDDAASRIVVLDAASMRELASVAAPQVLPFGFHAAFDAAT